MAQAYASKVIESEVSPSNAIAVLGKRKEDLEKLGSSHSIDRGVAGVGDRVEDVGNVVPEQRDRPKNQSGKMVTSLRGRTDSIVGRANRENNRTGGQDLEISGDKARVEVKNRPSIIIGIQFDRLGKTLAQFHTRSKSHCSSKLGKQGESISVNF